MYLELFGQMKKQLGQLQTWLDLAGKHAEDKKFDPNLFLSFRLAPEVALEPAPGGAIATINDQQVRITTEPVLECEVVEAPFSPGYGVEVPSRALHLARAAGAPPREDQRIVLSWRKTPES